MALIKTRISTILIQQSRLYSFLSRKLDKTVQLKCIYPVQSIQQRWLFWEKDRKGGYDTGHQVSIFQHLKQGFKELRGECKLWLHEVKELIETDPLLVARPGKISIFLFGSCALVGVASSVSHNPSQLIDLFIAAHLFLRMLKLFTTNFY